MSRKTLLIALTAALLPALATAEDTTVYKSKGASGETVYSQVETADAEAHRVGISEPEAEPAAEGEAETPKSRAQVACDRAKVNYELLASDRRISFDRDGDGVKEEMTEEERVRDRDLAQRQVAAYCEPEAEPGS